ncbi:hypothetical protein KIKIMORA_04810 [Brevundimonas phage vB_BpoS-Kikimora]|uniref:Uncharacterized protein n=1 Tax=Brevundimonas phage vB_BpoS-Kikimora TaxID=2948601 RepID=A0A9E7MSE6_9CAUD|nr:hypothetical protein KIKIMORA_04810 [Brevundimonas phage vB_BpoS-Kikimora]
MSSRIAYDVTISLKVFDPRALHAAAVAAYLDANPNAEPAEYADFLGSRANPDVSGCLRHLLDPGSLEGCEIEDSSAEAIMDLGDGYTTPERLSVLPVLVTLQNPEPTPGEAETFVARFATVEAAEAFLGSGHMMIDPDRLFNGAYSVIDSVTADVFMRDEIALFASTASDATVAPGTRVEIVRPLGDDECDPEVGAMYRVRLPGGEEEDAFADELTPIAFDADCQAGLHDWIGEPGRLHRDTTCGRCGERYGDPD